MAGCILRLSRKMITSITSFRPIPHQPSCNPPRLAPGMVLPAASSARVGGTERRHLQRHVLARWQPAILGRLRRADMGHPRAPAMHTGSPLLLPESVAPVGNVPRHCRRRPGGPVMVPEARGLTFGYVALDRQTGDTPPVKSPGSDAGRRSRGRGRLTPSLIAI